MCEIVAPAIGFLLILKAPKVLESVLIYFLNCMFLENYCVYLTDYKKIYKKIIMEQRLCTVAESAKDVCRNTTNVCRNTANVSLNTVPVVRNFFSLCLINFL